MLRCTGSSCQHATNPGCTCGCGGGNHGALARLAWAAALTVPAPQRTPAQSQQVATATAQRRRATSKVKHQEKTLRPSRKRPRRADATAFFESNRSVDIVDWLVSNPSERAKIEWMARQVGDTCDRVLKQHPKSHRRLADHFWCDALAALAQVLTEALNEIGKLPGRVSQFTVDLVGARTWEAVHTQRTESKGNAPCQKEETQKTLSRAHNDVAAGLHDAILEQAVKNLVKALMTGVTQTTHAALDPIILRLRVLAILFCPDPYAHKAVWDYCLVPLLNEGIVIRSQNYLRQFYDMFKQPWA